MHTVAVQHAHTHASLPLLPCLLPCFFSSVCAPSSRCLRAACARACCHPEVRSGELRLQALPEVRLRGAGCVCVCVCVAACARLQVPACACMHVLVLSCAMPCSICFLFPSAPVACLRFDSMQRAHIRTCDAHTQGFTMKMKPWTNHLR